MRRAQDAMAKACAKLESLLVDYLVKIVKVHLEKSCEDTNFLETARQIAKVLSPSASLGFTDFLQAHVPGVWYKSVIFGV